MRESIITHKKYTLNIYRSGEHEEHSGGHLFPNTCKVSSNTLAFLTSNATCLIPLLQTCPVSISARLFDKRMKNKHNLLSIK